MASPYTTIALINYNATAPSDDGTVADSNKIKWSYVKGKIGDPLVTQVAALDAWLLAAFGSAGLREPSAIAYQFTAWDPSDVAGTFTPPSGVTAASIAAANYITMGNSSGTLTLTFVKAGNFQVSVAMQNEALSPSDFTLGRVTLGGNATRYYGPTVSEIIAAVDTGSIAPVNLAGTLTIMVSATAGQTLTILPAIGVVSGGNPASNFTTNCSVTASYQGTT